MQSCKLPRTSIWCSLPGTIVVDSRLFCQIQSVKILRCGQDVLWKSPGIDQSRVILEPAVRLNANRSSHLIIELTVVELSIVELSIIDLSVVELTIVVKLSVVKLSIVQLLTGSSVELSIRLTVKLSIVELSIIELSAADWAVARSKSSTHQSSEFSLNASGRTLSGRDTVAFLQPSLPTVALDWCNSRFWMVVLVVVVVMSLVEGKWERCSYQWEHYSLRMEHYMLV